MHMGIHEPREHVLGRPVDHIDAVIGGNRLHRPDLGDTAIADQHVMGLVKLAARIQHMRAPDQQVDAGTGRAEQFRGGDQTTARGGHHATAARTGEPTSSS